MWENHLFDPIPIEYIKKCFQEPVPLLSDPLTWKTIPILIIESVREHLVKELMNSLLCREQLLCCGTNIHLRVKRRMVTESLAWTEGLFRGPRGKFLNVKRVCYHWKVKRKCIGSCLMKLNLQKIPIQKVEFLTIRPNMVGRIMVPRPLGICPNSSNLCTYVIWQKGIKVANTIKVANQMTLRWTDYSELFS